MEPITALGGNWGRTTCSSEKGSAEVLGIYSSTRALWK